VSFFSDERSSELRELFFESATELLQSLNDEGLKLEKNPADPEVLREVRRTVHTLKGDSAGCGYRELSELAHELEDILTPAIATTKKRKLAELVLKAADAFTALIAAYRTNSPSLPDCSQIREQIRRLIAKFPDRENKKRDKLAGRFAWTEYEQVMIEDAIRHGQSVFNIAVAIDPECAMPVAAFQMLHKVVQQTGTVLASAPEASAAIEKIDVVELAVATSESAEWFESKCLIPAMVSNVLVEQVSQQETTQRNPLAEGENEQDLLGILQSDPSAAGSPSANSADQRGAMASSSVIAENLLRVDADRIDQVLNLVGELIIGKSMLTQGMHEFDKRFAKDPLRLRFADAMAFQARVLNDLQKAVMKIRMVPVEQLFRRFPRIVRDTAKTCGKLAELQISGADTDLDKSILDALAEPLSHLVRNAIDHGIETPEERVAAGKLSQGLVHLHAYHQGNQIYIQCSDDGRGVDREKLIAKAIEQGVVTADEAGHMTESEGLNLVFHAGLSTAQRITAVSGRGVGMDVVRTVLERLKGSVTIQSIPGKGTTFLLKVPLTLAIIKALMFRVADRLFAVPLASVLEITRAGEHDVHRVDQHEVMQLRDEVLTLVRLNKLARTNGSHKRVFIVVVSIADRKFGLVVDRMVGEEELVIKALDDHLVATDLVSGASILGDGTVVLILNLSAVVPRFAKHPVGATA
jgi:two-component system, chemotaxis family, sensor kinase CheA